MVNKCVMFVLNSIIEWLWVDTARTWHLNKNCHPYLSIGNRDGNGAGRGRRMRSSSPPCMVLSCTIPALPRMAGKTFSPHPRPLGPREAPSHSVKLYFLLIYSITSTIFLMKPILLIKIYSKLQLNLSHQIKSFLEKIE